MTTSRDELDALLVKRALEGLDENESRRLDALAAEFGDVDPDWVDRLVGELDAASVAADAPPLSPGLRDAVLAEAPGRRESARSPDTARRSSTRWRAWGGWAAAAVLGALWIGSPSRVEVSTPAFATVAASPDAVVAEWVPGPDPTGARVEGQIVWSSDTQAGVMRLRGLQVNVPEEYQYQLWIFDRDRDERYPVDGGVFDMPPGGEAAEVPIQAKLVVAEPALFAVTVEKPGGVVVSSRERIATVAEVTD